MYVAAYQEERKRARGDAFRKRALAQKALDDTKAEMTRIVHLVAKDFLPETELPGMLAPLRAERDCQQAILESVEEPENIIEIQPKAVIRFREDTESLVQIVKEEGGNISPELTVPLRQLVAAVIVEPRKPGDPYSVSIKSW